MDTSLRSGGPRRLRGVFGLHLAIALGLLGGSPSPALALDRDYVLRFLPPTNTGVTGYTAYVTDAASEVEELLDLGFVAPDADGVARTSLVLDAARSYDVAMTASNEAGESALSNQIHVAALAPVCDPASCDDADPCSADSCDAAGCFHTPLPDGTACDDGYVDTVDDQCVQGVCEGVLLVCRDDLDCDDGDVCNGIETCDGGSVCLEGIPLECGTPTACAVPRCDAVAGCLMEILPDGAPCDDGLSDTRGDACSSGLCVGVADSSGPLLGIEAVSPGAVATGRYTIVVSGQGFAPGATLDFLNGQGKPPIVRALRLVDAGTLEATIDVSRKRPRRPSFWDVRVALPDGREALLGGVLRIER